MKLSIQGNPDPIIMSVINACYNIEAKTGLKDATAVALFHGAPGSARDFALKNKLMIIHDADPDYGLWEG